MLSQDWREIEQLVRKVFRELPPIRDEELCREGFDVPTSGNQLLRAFRGRRRFDLAGSSDYLGPEALGVESDEASGFGLDVR